MLRKAQSITEFGIMIAIVAVVTIATFTIYNNQKLKLVKMSAVTLTNSATATVAETSGRASVKGFMGRSDDQNTASVANLTSDTLASHSDVISDANDLGAQISSDNTDQELLAKLVDRVNSIAQRNQATWTASETKFMAKFASLLDDSDVMVASSSTADSHKPINASTTTSGSTSSSGSTTTTSSTSTSGGSSNYVCKQTGVCDFNKHTVAEQ